MAKLTLTDEQVIDIVNQLSPERKRALIMELAVAAAAKREERMEHVENRLQQLTAERGLNWDSMSEEEREIFIDDMIHDDRRFA